VTTSPRIRFSENPYFIHNSSVAFQWNSKHSDKVTVE